MTHPPEEMDVWILAGQSNMEGVGELAAALPPDENVWSFTSAGRWEIAVEPLHRFWESFTPIHPQLMRPNLPAERRDWTNEQLAERERAERIYGAGLGVAFAKSMLERTGRPVGLIPAAHGGTSLSQWSPDLKSQRGESLYGAMFERLARSGRKPKGLLWYQGESEGWNLDAARAYGKNFADWIARLRADLGEPNFPVALVQISRTTLDSVVSAAWNAIQHAQYELPTRVSGVAVTGAVDLPLIDCIHISAAGLQRLGHRLANAATALLAGVPGDRIGPRLLRVAHAAEPPDRAIVDLTFANVTGAWQPADHIAGFEVLAANGEPHPSCHVINAMRHPADPTAIRVRLCIPLTKGEKIAYAYGIRPYCNAVDEADFPLCAFDVTPDGVA